MTGYISGLYLYGAHVQRYCDFSFQRKRYMKLFKILVIVSLAVPVFAQEPSPYDFGRMWTFENPPKEWFEKAYHFDADTAWFNRAQRSALRFATWCSASFVSPDGLVMTNHHCSRDVVGALQREGENFDKNGFYAATQSDERKADGLFVEQLVRIEDITARVQELTGNVENDADMLNKRRAAFQQIQSEFALRPGWEGLRLQIVSFYSGMKFSVYGYRRYDDVRLVFIPELDMGYFGGDPDNFTFPRYCLDVTFWRVYDDNGQPLNTSKFYFHFSDAGAAEGEPVFVIGNPGNTERYRTVSQLEYDRDYRYPVQLAALKDQYARLDEKNQKDPSRDLQEQMFSLSNSIKAYTGILDGLRNPDLFGRKVAMEKKIRSKSTADPWDKLTTDYNAMGPQVPELQFLDPRSSGSTVALMHELHELKDKVASGETEGLEDLKSNIRTTSADMTSEDEPELLATVLRELKKFADPGDTYIDDILNGRSPEDAAADILKKTDFTNSNKVDKLMDKKPEKIVKDNDIVMKMSDQLMPLYYKAVDYFRATGPERRNYETQVVQQVFNVFGDELPPDATFTLRISDGVVKRYNYNGTIAPYKTTFFGLYDRYYSNDKSAPWEIPDRWANPPMDLLKSPMDFVSTADIIGGNSGSPVINEKQQIVGLIFDGNIESLPGNFIYDEEYNRAVAVHSSGILAALQYIYKADRLLNELTQ